LAFGESWHNNHHAFPASARHGLYPGQLDLGYEFIRFLERLGLAWDVQTPDTLPPRTGITRVDKRCSNPMPATSEIEMRPSQCTEQR
jgi:stearoyl-CoA desaturase (delta-9 desaturase)